MVVGEARAEELEGALERGEGGVLWSAEAEEARDLRVSLRQSRAAL